MSVCLFSDLWRILRRSLQVVRVSSSRRVVEAASAARRRERSMSQIVRREVRLRWFDGSMGGYCRVRHYQMVSLSPERVLRIVLGG